jgi:hypothetical protein
MWKAATALALLGVASAVGGLSGVAQAQVAPSMDLAPSTGPTGTVVAISGVVDPATCGQATQITNYIITRTQFIEVTLPITVGTDGSFATSVTIPATFYDGFNDIDAPLQAGTAITFEINCPSGPVTADFTVTSSATTTTTTPATTAPPTTVAGPFVPPAEPPADAGDFAGPLPGSVAPGGQITIDEPGFVPGEEVVVVLYSDPKILTTVDADGTGRVLAAAAVPADTAPGAHTVVLFSASKVVKAPLTVTALPAQAPADTLPRTGPGGAGTAGSAALAGALVAAGAVLVAASRRRAGAA